MLAAVALWTAATQAVPDIVLKVGDTVPDARPCVDYVLRGRLRSDGEPQLIDDPDDLIGHSIYGYRFELAGSVFGTPPRRIGRLVRAGHALAKVDFDDVVVVLSRSAEGKLRFIAWEHVWHDRRGKAFVPIFDLPDTPGNMDWRPVATRSITRSVSYAASQPGWPGHRLTVVDEKPGFVETIRGRTRVLTGLYLSDIPRLMGGAENEQCWR